MINDNLKISLPFYDDVLKQNRYRNQCAAICDFKLLQPPNKIPPFQLQFPSGTTDGIDHWYIRCCGDDSILYDLTSHIVNISFDQKTELEFYTYSGFVFNELSISCGCYYLELGIIDFADEPPEPVINYYSEVFNVIDELTDLSFVQSQFPIPNIWRWYNNIDKQNRYKNYCASVCDFYLLSGNDSLIPFQFRFPYLLPISYTIVWSIISVADDCETFLDSSLLSVYYADGQNYITYLGDSINLPCGKFYSKINIDGQIFYSELIQIIDEADNTGTNYLLLESGFRLLLETGFGILL